MAAPKSRNAVVFAEDLHPDHLTVVKTVCFEVFEAPPSTAQIFGELSNRIRAELDKQLGGRGWNVIVGRGFGAYVSHKIKCFAYLSVCPGVNVLAWKA
jgi:hypothetical protein